jgi:drug/metabolite transporter, DME family
LEQPLQSRQGLGLVVLATVGWSLSGLFVRLLPNLDGWQITCWRGFWLAITLLVYLTLRYRGGLIDVFRQVPAQAMIISALGFAFGTTCYVVSLTLDNTATVSTIGATSPLITALLSYWVTGERPSILNWLAGVLVLIGMVVIVRHGYEAHNIGGILLALGVPITFASQTLLLRLYRHIDMMTTICVGGFVSFVVGAVVSLTVTGNSAFTLTSHDMGLLLVMGVVQLGVPLILYGWGAKSVPAVMLAIVAMLDAVFNPFWSWAFVNETPDVDTLIGGSIIVAAVIISIATSSYRRPDTPHA